MSTQSDTRPGGWIAICTIAVLVPWSQVHAAKTIEERRAADPQGEIEIVNVSGKVEVAGWNRSEVEVSGTAGDNVERVDVTTAGSRTTIHVASRSAHTWGSDGEANLVVHVPVKSAVTATLVSADFSVTGVMGNLKLQAVSGNLSGDAGGDIRATTVSGDVRLAGRAAKEIEVKTISGDIHLMGGGGDVEITTVSGNATIELADVSRARFKSVSGDMTVALALAQGGQIESESVSGGVSLKFAATPAAEFDVQSFSGMIRNCFGPKPVQPQYGPGSRLQFTNGEGHGRVRINTKNGDVQLCVKGVGSGGHAATLPIARLHRVDWAVPYVY
ncbi:MAG TPA: DUF4097 family beta strand repeat-containing protein [Steroidobacteraceae bacterium]|jgi:hypothetical protein|nr:DUF4097 family beta strand repeat-containing protein [Steroidobacteraceae bacterium]